MSGIFSFIIVLGALVFVHELGHFLLARMLKVKVLKFSLGFGPKLAGIKRGDTEYLISAIPLGGYVKLLGDDPEVEVSEEEKQYAFLAQRGWKKAAIVAAGPIFNLVFAYLIFTSTYIAAGMPRPLAHVGAVAEDSPASRAGLKEKDEIISVEGEPIRYWEEIGAAIQRHGGKELTLEVKRDGSAVNLKITPEHKDVVNIFNESQKLWMIGIHPGEEIFVEDVGVFRSFLLGYQKTVEIIDLTITGIIKTIDGTVSADNIGGPILIAQMTAKTAEQGFLSVLMFTALLSINLGLINLFPIPILDGGHLLFFAIEGIIRREINVKYKEVAQQVGLMLLVALMIFAFYNDFTR